MTLDTGCRLTEVLSCRCGVVDYMVGYFVLLDWMDQLSSISFPMKFFNLNISMKKQGLDSKVNEFMKDDLVFLLYLYF